MGAQNVLVSLGGEGALWVSESGAMVAPAIPVRVQSTVGAATQCRRCDGWLGENRGRSPCAGVWRGGWLCIGNDRGDAADSPR